MWTTKHTGAFGTALVFAITVAIDIAFIKKDAQSISAFFQEIKKHPYYGPAVTGFWAGLTYHFFLEAPRSCE